MIRSDEARDRFMSSKLAFLHTSHVLIPMFAGLAKDLLPEFEVFHMTDESLIRNTIAAQRLTPVTVRRLSAMIGSASEGGASAVMVTCSSIGPAVEFARSLYEFPIFRIDEAMAETAASTGHRIGVAATLRTTLEPTLALLRDTAARMKKEVELVPALFEGAFEAVLAGDTARHDTLVVNGLTGLRERSDVVVLAQASMARVLSQLPPNEGCPILSSPELAVRRMRKVLFEQSTAAKK
jgi:Asp/Glu/hydantoin racemase